MYYILAALLMLCASTAAPAQDTPAQPPPPWYQVEIVIFQHDDTSDTEIWPDDPGVPATAKSVALTAPAPASPEAGAAARPGASPDVGTPPGTGSTSDAGTSPGAGDAPDASPAPPAAATGAQPATAVTAPPAAVTAAAAAFHPLPDSELALNSAVDRLNRTPGYQVLYHAAWRQPVYDPDHTRPVHIMADPLAVTAAPSTDPSAMASPAAAATATPAPAAAAAVTGSDTSAAQAPPPPPPWLLNGTITLAQSRYLHLDVDMVFQQRVTAAPAAVPAPVAAGDAVQRFRLQQSRRIVSGQLYYFDHPRFGVLAQIVPYQPPAPDNTGAQPAPAAAGGAATPLKVGE